MACLLSLSPFYFIRCTEKIKEIKQQDRSRALYLFLFSMIFLIYWRAPKIKETRKIDGELMA